MTSIAIFSNRFARPVLCLALLVGATVAQTIASAATLQVGPGRVLTKPCAAFAVAADGDVIEIDGNAVYSADACGIYRNALVIRGVNGRPKIDAAGASAMGKGTWVIVGNDVTVENVEMSGARVADRNGAALRLEGTNFTLRGSFLRDNENGILTGAIPGSRILIEHSEFGHNGYGDGYSHNIYIGNVASLTFRHNFSHDANAGHNLKSRAIVNTISYNRFSSTAPGVTGSTASGQPSYEIDLPNAGTSYVIGNVIQQPAANQNAAMLAYGEEGVTNPGQDLYVVNNTFLNDDASRGTFILAGGAVTTPILMQNNIFSGVGTTTTQTNAIDRTNYRSLTPGFVNRANYDLRPTDALVVDSGSTPGVSAAAVSLTPTVHYVHVAGAAPRPVAGQIDIGAYEAGTATAPAPVTLDTVPPAVAFSSPVNGANVRKTLVIAVGATDNVAVTKLSVFMDGKLIASVQGGSLNTSMNVQRMTGMHTLTATAVDAAKNQTSTSVVVNVTR